MTIMMMMMMLMMMMMMMTMTTTTIIIMMNVLTPYVSVVICEIYTTFLFLVSLGVALRI
jgi:hypothetical protein